MLRIRLRRVGRKRVNVFRIVAADARRKRDNRGIEDLGYYQPQFSSTYLMIDLQKVDLLMKNGAIPTERVIKLIAIARANEKYVIKPKAK